MAKRTAIQIRIDEKTKAKIEEKAKGLGFKSLSEYMLFIALNAEIKITATKEDL